MSDTPTPTDLAAIIAYCSQMNESGAFCACALPNHSKCLESCSYRACRSATALLAAASRPAPPVADGEVAELIAEADQRVATDCCSSNWFCFDYWPRLRSLLLRLSSQLTAAEARAVQMEARWESTEEAYERAASESAALRERVGVLTEAVRKAVPLILGDHDYGPGSVEAVDLLKDALSASASPVPQPAPGSLAAALAPSGDMAWCPTCSTPPNKWIGHAGEPCPAQPAPAKPEPEVTK